MAITYNPAFQHQDWIDNVDRVQAGGGNGINVRFHQLEVEFHAISAVVAQLSAAIDAINTTLATLTLKPQPQDLTMRIAPALFPSSGVPWTNVLGHVEKTVGQTSAHGWMPLTFLDRAYVSEMSVQGNNTGSGTLAITVRRQALASPNKIEILMEVDGANGGVVQGGGIDPKFIIDNSKFNYFLVVDLDNAAAADSVAISSIGIGYTIGKAGV